MSIKEHPPHHVPVLLDACIELLKPKIGESYLDLTAGYGGHAQAFLAKTNNYSDSILVDRDEYAQQHLSRFSKKGAKLMHSDFVAAARQLVDMQKQFDLIIIDLGVSSPQLDIAERGFSFANSGPLDMRMDRSQALTARTLVNKASKQELIKILCEYGEEPRGSAHRIAQAIVTSRPLETTDQLATTVLSVHKGKWQKTHPATRTFQAIRIAVNQELLQITEVLPLIPKLLRKGGRVGIISFHSLEDRIVKRFLNDQRDAGYEAELTVLTKKPLGGAQYDVHNPRSRSAKLRVAVKK